MMSKCSDHQPNRPKPTDCMVGLWGIWAGRKVPPLLPRGGSITALQKYSALFSYKSDKVFGLDGVAPLPVRPSVL